MSSPTPTFPTPDQQMRTNALQEARAYATVVDRNMSWEDVIRLAEQGRQFIQNGRLDG